MLGPLEVREGDDIIDVRGSRLQALLVRLANDAGRVVSVEALSAAVWDEDAPGDGPNALQSLVSRLRRLLPDASLVGSRPGGYLLAVDPSDVDALHFAELAGRGRAALRRDDPAAASSILHDALGLWRGDAVPELRGTGFGESTATELGQAYRAALEDRLDADVRLGRGPDVLSHLQALAQADPYDERVAGLLMQALFDAGRQADALDAYERVRGQLAERLGVDPSPALKAIHLGLLRGEAGHAPTAVLHRSNLPSTVSSFLGRDGDLQQLAAMLSSHRLVTVVGPGGCGKTRLAIEAAARERARGPVWLVELAPVTDPDDVAQATLDALDVRDAPALENRRRRPSRDALAHLEDALGDGSALIVLDNCEHLVDAAARLAEHLLTRCSRLRILATSREPLAIGGEVLHPIRTLAIPPAGASSGEALRSDAVRLFVERAAAVQPAFELDVDSTPSVIEVCRRLDGLPLAIELAAARMRTMTVQQLEFRLDDRFRLLTGGSRTSVARHRTLRAVVEWSWDLLNAEERLLAERFSVFPGGATAAAARTVCLPDLDTDDVEDAFAALADKSLLQVVTPRGRRVPRYRMLETLREYGGEKLAARDELLATRRAHTRYFRDLAERTEPLLRGPDQLAAIDVLDVERDNILAALRFAVDEGDADTAVRLAASQGWYWLMKDSHAEAATWMQVALDVEGAAQEQSRDLVQVLHLVNAAASGQIDLSGDEEMGHGIGRLVNAMPDIDGLSGHPLLALIGPAKALLLEGGLGEPGRWDAAFQRALEHPDPWAKGALFLLRFQHNENLGDTEAMREAAEQALYYFRLTGDRWGVAVSLTSLGGVLTMGQDYVGALAAYEESQRLTAELLPQSRDNAEVLLRLAIVHSRMGDPARARQFIERASASAQESGSRHHRVFVEVGRAHLEWVEGDLDAAQVALDEALARIEASPQVVPQMHAFVHAALAQLAVARGDLDTVQPRLARAFVQARSTRDNPITAQVAVATAAWLGATGDPARGARVLGVAAALRGSTDAGNPEVAWVMSGLRSQLGDADYEAGFIAGRACDGLQALDVLADAIGIPDEARPVAVPTSR